MEISHSSDLQCKGLCPSLLVFQWKQGSDWETQKIYTSQLRVQGRGQVPSIISEDTQVFVIIANADTLYKCPQCRQIFTHTFCMRKNFWSESIRNSNGYFGCETTYDTTAVAGLNTWSYFEIKNLKSVTNYTWSKANTFTRWIASTNQTALILFDPTERINQTPEPDEPSHLRDPFWIYIHILEELVKLQDSAVWSIRNQVRALEKQDKPIGRPQPDYRHLHDMGRHAVHSTESLDVALHVVEQILKNHLRYASKGPMLALATGSGSGSGSSSNSTSGSTTDLNSKKNIFHLPQPTLYDIQTRLEFTQTCLNSLRHRSIANEKRLQNEIQLAFNTVAQHDASLSVKISHAMMSDSTALKTLAFVTFAFLPPTFISSIFSMSFFNYDSATGVTMSRDIWIYWAFALPTTAVSMIVWTFWSRISPKERRDAPLRSAATVELRDLV